MKDQGIGASVRRKEDFRFLTAVGNYTDDIDRPGQLYAYILRSLHAHAEIADIDTNNTTALDILAVFIAADMQVGDLPCGAGKLQRRLSDGGTAAPVLAQGKVRHVGDPVAVVIAGSLAQAKDCAELIQVSYQLLPVVVAADQAIKPDRPQLFENALNNICFDRHLGDKAAVETAFTGARHVTRLDLPIARTAGNLPD